MQEQLTHLTESLINKAIQIATEHKNPSVQPLHLVAATLEIPFCISSMPS